MNSCNRPTNLSDIFYHRQMETCQLRLMLYHLTEHANSGKLQVLMEINRRRSQILSPICHSKLCPLHTTMCISLPVNCATTYRRCSSSPLICWPQKIIFPSLAHGTPLRHLAHFLIMPMVASVCSCEIKGVKSPKRQSSWSCFA